MICPLEKNLIYNVDKLVQSDKKQLKFKIIRVKKISEMLLRLIRKSYDAPRFFQQLEILLFNFYLDTLKSIIQIKKNKKKDIYKAIISSINITLNQIKIKKKHIISKSNHENDEKERIDVLNEIICCLKDIKNIKEQKVFMNEALMKPCTIFLKNI
ncbi:hypothetical protein NUSPORA_02133 [Nucleospora cyclopteri]